MAASEEELLLLGLFGEDAELLLRGIRGRGRRDVDELAGVDKRRAERIREVVRIVQETGIGEVTIEEEGMRVSVRATPEPPVGQVSEAPLALPEPAQRMRRDTHIFPGRLSRKLTVNELTSSHRVSATRGRHNRGSYERCN